MKLRKFKIGKLDLYIMGKFIGTYLFTILLLVIIIIVFDAAEKMDDFLELNAPLSSIFLTYYLNFVPFILNQFSSLIIFIAVIFFTSKLAYNTEIVAILSNGISFRRFLYPYFISSILVAAFSLALNLYIIPHSNEIRIEFESRYLKKGQRDNFDSHIYKQVNDTTFAYIKGYNSIRHSCEYLVLETIKDNIITSSLTAKTVKVNDKTSRWSASKYLNREFIDGVEVLEKKDNLDTLINLSTNELGKVENYIQTLNINELNTFISEQQRKGSSQMNMFLVDKHNRYAYPFSALILTLIGVSLSSRKVRGGTGLHIGIGIGLCFSYILFMRFANEFAKGQVLPAVIAVWLPNILFAFIGIYLYRKAPK